MAFAKTTDFTPDQTSLAVMAKALGHPARVAIVELLARRQTCVSGDICDEIPLSRTTVAQHLKALKTAGIIQGEVDGAKVCYCLNLESLARAQAKFMSFFAAIDCCKPASTPAPKPLQSTAS